MTVKIIAERTIEEDQFLSATEQAGIFIGQPVPDDANTGGLRPITKGDEDGTINDLTYDGTISGDWQRMTNGRFEKPFTAGLAQSWGKFGAAATYAQETTLIHDGRSSQKVTCVDDGETIGIGQSLTTASGSTYRIIVWVYCNENTTVTIAHANLTGNSDTFAINATAWTKCVWEVVADATGAADLQIYRAIADSDVADYLIVDSVSVSSLGKNIFWDESLMVFDNKALIGGTIEFTSGTNDGETGVITDNQGGSGYIALNALATANIIEDDTYTLTIAAAGLDMEVEMMTAGDIGDAKFKWSFNGGTNDIAREYAPGGGEHAVAIYEGAANDGTCKIIEMPNGTLLAVYSNGSDELSYKTSTDQGLSWSAATVIEDDDAFYLTDAIVLENGRVMVFAWLGAGLGTDLFYSDDNATNWSDKIHLTPDLKCVIELPNNNLLGFNDENSDIRCQLSDDGGLTWGSEITIVQEANDQLHPSACIAQNGDVICAYDSDEDNATDAEIRCKISSDGGATWGAEIDIYDYTAGLCSNQPWVFTYTNGDIYVFYVMEQAAGEPNLILFKSSSDNGLTWGGVTVSTTFTLPYDQEIKLPRASVVFGTMVWISYLDSSWTMAHVTFRHQYPAGDSSLYGVVTAVNNSLQQLYCDVNLQWHGASGAAGDKWTFTPDYIYAAKNMISNLSNKAWRSTTDGAACNIVIANGANERYLVDGVAFFNCNFWDLNFQMHTADSWGTPDVDEDVIFQWITGTVDSVNGNYIVDAALLADYKDHALAGMYFMPTSGTDSGVAFEIKDNVDTSIVLDTTAAHSIATNDTFRIFKDRMAATFTGGTKRYLRINIPAQQTPDDYYQVGTMIAGKAISLSKAWLRGFSKITKSGVEYLRPIDGGIVPVERAENKKVFQASWNGAEDTIEEVEALFNYLRGRNLALIPDHTDLTDIYCCKIIGSLEARHWYKDKYSFSLTFEEI